MNRGNIWIHCASLGEAKGAFSLMEQLSARIPEKRWVLTATTSSGTNWLRQKSIQKLVSFPGFSLITQRVPFLFAPFIERFINKNRIRYCLLYEHEVWPAIVNSCQKQNVIMLWVSARITPRTVRYYSLTWFYWNKKLRPLSFIQYQSHQDKIRGNKFFSQIESQIGCDYKALTYLPNSGNQPVKRDFKKKVFAFLSLHFSELKKLLKVISVMDENLFIIIQPRNPGEFSRFIKTLMPFGYQPVEKGSHNRQISSFTDFQDLISNWVELDHRGLIVNELGKTRQILSVSSLCFVGGSFVPKGCHNLLEPLASKIKSLHGPYYYNQAYAAELLERHGLSQTIHAPEEILQKIKEPLPEIDPFQPLINEITEQVKSSVDHLVSKMNEF